MKLDRMRGSSNVEDRRGGGARRGVALGGAVGGGGAIIAIVVSLLMGGDPLAIVGSLFSGTSLGASSSYAAGYVGDADEEALAVMARKVLGSTEDVWNQLFDSMGESYEVPTLVLFSGEVDSACGYATAATGPFYCSGDGKVYLDLSFFSELARDYGGVGDFAQAYVIAHEVGHHVQALLGTLQWEVARERELTKEDANALSVRLELQADFYAGLWAHYFARMEGGELIDEGDVEEALAAAAGIGDDRIQMEARGYAVPETFTHGTAAQRARWFTLGYRTGDLEKGDTFAARDL